MTTHIALSGPQSQYKKAQAALTAADFPLVLDFKTGEPVANSWGSPDSTETAWTGSRWEKGDVEAVGDQCTCQGQAAHAHDIGDLVWGTGEIVSVPSEHPTMWLTVKGDDPAKAALAVDALKWTVRSVMEHSSSEIALPDVLTRDVRLARIEAELALLKAGQ